MDNRTQPVLNEPDGQARLFPASESTHRNYEAQWKRFKEWADYKGVSSEMPLEPEVVCDYLEDRFLGNLPPAWNKPDTSSMKPGTLRVAVAAIVYMHDWRNLPNPCMSLTVRETVSHIIHNHSPDSEHSAPLDRAAFDRIRQTVTLPRIGRGGKLERRRTALWRGRLDIALIGLMRDATLLVDEAACLRWEDIEEQGNGSGLVRFRRPHPRRDNETAGISPQTMADLARIRGCSDKSGSVLACPRTR